MWVKTGPYTHCGVCTNRCKYDCTFVVRHGSEWRSRIAATGIGFRSPHESDGSTGTRPLLGDDPRLDVRYHDEEWACPRIATAISSRCPAWVAEEGGQLLQIAELVAGAKKCRQRHKAAAGKRRNRCDYQAVTAAVERVELGSDMRKMRLTTWPNWPESVPVL